jgi:DNA-binding transcriptional LysR family regulator
MNLAEIEAFLVLAEELHFARAAERLLLSPSRVSKQVSSLEQEVGGQLFERSTRRVILTPLGAELRDRLQPAHRRLHDALAQTQASALAAGGLLRVGVTQTIGSPVLGRLIDGFQLEHPHRWVEVHEVDLWDPYDPLRQRQIDVLVNWLVVDESDLTVGPVLERRPRVLAVGASHHLAKRESVSIEDFAHEQFGDKSRPYPPALLEVLAPFATPTGRSIVRGKSVDAFQDLLYDVALGRVVHPTMAGISAFIRPDIVLVPVCDMPPMPLGLIWCTAHENARIRSLAELARSLDDGPGPG